MSDLSFTDTKILLSNYPNLQQSVNFQRIDGKEEINIICGYDLQVDNHQVTLQIARDLIIAILAYDNVYIEGKHIWDVVQVFGSDNIGELLRCNIIHFIPDNTLNPVMMLGADKTWKPGFFPYTMGIANNKGESVFKARQEEWCEIELTLYKLGITGTEVQAFLYLIDDKKKMLDQDTIKKLTLQETFNDLKNKRFVTNNSILRTNESGLTEFHQLNILRLHELNTVAVTAGLLEADALKTDGYISDLMNQKCASVFSKKIKDGVSAVQSILHQKGFPDLGEMFVNSVIDIDDILKLRNSLHGKLFRYWAMTDGYDENLMQKDIMNSIHSVLGSKINSMIRFVACSAIGLFSSAAGITASVFDSYVLNKVAQGWHPNFFLDDKVKGAIDKSIKKKEEEERIALKREYFKGIGRNEPCSCGSGKKFKYCHGKNI